MSIERRGVFASLRPEGIFTTDTRSSGAEVESPSQGLNRQIEQYLAFLSNEKSASENTIAAYRNDLSQLWEHLQTLGAPLCVIDSETQETHIDWTKVTQDNLRGYVSALEDRGYAVKTVDRKAASARSFFQWLNAEGVVKTDPSENLQSTKLEEKSFPRTLSKDEVERLLEAPRAKPGPIGIRDAAILQLFWATGMRVSELSGLDIDDINLVLDYVKCGEGLRERKISFDYKTHRILEEYLASENRGRFAKGDTPSVFLSDQGERLDRGKIWQMVRKYAQAAGIPGSVTPHTLRHSFAIHLLENHANIRDVQELLGHANIATTEMYTKIVGSRGGAHTG